MLKSEAKRRRPPAQVKAEKEAKATVEADAQAKLAELQALEAQLAARKEQVDNALAAERLLNDLINRKEVKKYDDGSWGAVIPDQAMPE